MSGDDQIKGWRDYRRLLPTVQLNGLLRRSDDSGWPATRELLARMGWSNLNRVALITGDTLGRGIVYVLLPDETVAQVSSEYGTYETCSVQESPIGMCSTQSPYGMPLSGGLHDPDSLVFTSPGGCPVHWSNFKNRVWYPALDHVGVRRCKVYALRHTSGSLLAAAGVPLHDVKVQLGHSSITTTESYLHFYPDGVEDVAVGMSLSTYKQRDLFGSWCAHYFLPEQEEGRRMSRSGIDVGT